MRRGIADHQDAWAPGKQASQEAIASRPLKALFASPWRTGHLGGFPFLASETAGNPFLGRGWQRMDITRGRE